MNAKGEKLIGVRSFQDGQWYWAPRIVIQEMSKDLGFLALAVYHFLASMVDSKQTCFPSQTRMAEALGCSRTSVTRAVKILEAQKLIRVIREGNSPNRYQLLKVGSQSAQPQMSTDEHLNVNPDDTNDIRLSKSSTGVRHFHSQGNRQPKYFKPETREEILAFDLATALNEPDELPFYLSFAQTYPESFLRETLSRVNQTPRHRIKKSRAALFTYLVRRYGNGANQNLSD
jgi:DNA-binding transcriptional MocR family regulator